MTLKAKPIRSKKCANCKESFTPDRPFVAWCSIDCAVVIARLKQAKQKARDATQERARHAKAKEAVKTKGQHMKEAQMAFNAVIRERDKDLPCVSCDKPATWHGQWHASHLRSVGSTPELRFEELNVHKACSVCNSHLSGNLLGYLPRLILRIGQDKVDWLQGKHESKRYSIDDLKAIKAEYRAKLREMKAMN